MFKIKRSSISRLLVLGYTLLVFCNCSSESAEEIEIIDTVAIRCDQDFGDPNQSLYILPFPVGNEYLLSQSYCPANPNWGHYNWFAYDFDMPNRDTIIASWSGTVRAVQENQPNIPGACNSGKENYIYIEHGDVTLMSYVP